MESEYPMLLINKDHNATGSKKKEAPEGLLIGYYNNTTLSKKKEAPEDLLIGY